MNKFLHILATVGKGTGKIAVKGAEEIAPVAVGIINPQLGSVVANGIQIFRSEDSKSMNPLEAMAISMVLGTLQTVIKDPKHKALLQNQLLGLAADIQTAYGLVPPTAPAPTAA